jgi:hypothetical protein
MRVITLALILSACGSDGGSGSATFTTSVPSATPLNMLSSSQLQTLCNDLKSFAMSSSVYADAKDAGCRLAGMIAAALSGKTTDSDLQAACTTAYNQCKSAPVDSGTMTDTGLACTAAPPTCTATVGEVTTCLNDEFSQLGQLLKSIPSCSQLTKAYLNGDAGIVGGSNEAPASCKSLEAKCPEQS